MRLYNKFLMATAVMTVSAIPLKASDVGHSQTSRIQERQLSKNLSMKEEILKQIKNDLDSGIVDDASAQLLRTRIPKLEADISKLKTDLGQH